jgi:peptidyl-prolyl cis-trans isomerase B (cyclophilin B)
MCRTLRIGIALTMVLAAVLVPGCVPPKEREEQGVSEKDKTPVVVIETSMGTIKAELWPDKSPRTVGNFLRYVDEEFYDGLIFHRVMPKFMIQCGGFTPGMEQKRTHENIVNEARSDVPNERGTLAMARAPDPHSASAQFFINVVDNDFLNHRDNTQAGFGYCVFGKVVDGLDVADEIAKVRTRTVGQHENVPVEPVVIRSIRRAE